MVLNNAELWDTNLVCKIQMTKMVINIWHQMLYENRKVLREVCDNYEKHARI